MLSIEMQMKRKMKMKMSKSIVCGDLTLGGRVCQRIFAGVYRSR